METTKESDERARALIATIGLELSRLPEPVAARLIASWIELVTLLEPVPVPEARECPVCKHTGMRAATRCGYCWSSLPLLA